MSVNQNDTIAGASSEQVLATCIKSLHLMGEGGRDDFIDVYTPDASNRESVAEPAASRGVGPDAFFATAQWLRTAFSSLRWDVHEVVHERDVVVMHATMTGHHTGPFVAYGPDASIEAVFPATGRDFTVTQTHWFRVSDGRVAEHWANRDDQSMGRQLGWIPPRPAYLARMILARRRLRRAEQTR